MARLVCRENIDLQSKKIREVAEALIAAGYVCLDKQASALGLPRSTTWTILNTKHKNSGLSASVVKKVLAQPHLPERVRRKILEYVEQKSSGAYGHNPQRARRFASGLAGWALDGRASSPALILKQTFDWTSRQAHAIPEGELGPSSLDGLSDQAQAVRRLIDPELLDGRSDR